jgi:uncharacterized protein YegL
VTEERTPERDRAEQGQLVMPFYLICDVSYSMANEMPSLNRGVRRLRQAIVTEPVVDEVAQICVMTFSDKAKVIVPLGPMSEAEIPALSAEDTTDYGAAFHALAKAIEQDHARLKERGLQIYRPCAFFLTDGIPTDRDWHKTFVETLTYNEKTGEGMKAHPIFVPFGFRHAKDEILRQLSYPPDRSKWYHAEGANIDQVLTGLIDIIKRSVVSSVQSSGDGKPVIVMPTPTPGSGITRQDSGYDPNFLS